MNVFCRVFEHKRSAARVYTVEPEVFRSVCRRCETPMIKTESGTWLTLKAHRDLTAPMRS